MKRIRFLTFAVLAFLMLMLLTTLSASATTATFPTFTLSASSTQLHYDLPLNTQFNGSISTTGPVRFFVSDPKGMVIVNLGLVDKAATFSLVSNQTGNYTMNFEDDMPNTIQVSFSYVTNPDIAGGNSGGLSLVYLPIFVFVVVFGSIIIIVVGRRRNKDQVESDRILRG